MRGLRVQLLGSPRLELDGQPLTRLMPVKHQALVYYLAAHDQPVRRSRLATLLWSQLDVTAARGNLRVALSRLRRQLPDVLAIDSDEVGLAPSGAIRVDLRELEQVAANPAAVPHDRAAAVAASWRGPLLDGFDPGDADEFEQWLLASRQRAARMAVALRAHLARICEEEGRIAEAIEHLRGWLDIDDADEQAHMALMRLLAADGRRTAALAQYEVCRATLLERLGARPSADCYSLYCRIHADAPASVAPQQVAPQQVAPELVAPQPVAPRSPGSPAEGARLVGRAAEIALIVERLLDPHCRWLTIVGPGGIGKTRVAAAAAARLQAHFPGGLTWFSGREVAAGHGGAGSGRSRAEDIAREVAGRRQSAPSAPALLVLDNLESLTDARELVEMLLRQLRNVRVLATSRVRVGASREWLLELAGLDAARARPDDPCSSPAAELFVESLRRFAPRFEAGPHGAAIERICRRVGGLPLALELAAHGAHVAGVEVIADRIDEGAGLSDPDRPADDPHRSLDVVLADSWRSLPAQARAAALRLAALPDEFDAALAATVQVPFDELEVLRRHSWLGQSGAGRLAMHPLQRAFLRRSAEAAATAIEVPAAVATRLRAALPSVEPFGSLQDRALRTEAEEGGAIFDGPVVTMAVEHAIASWPDEALCRLVDDVVAWLEARGRHLEAAALLEAPSRIERLPAWRRIGWRLRQGELMNQHGAALAAACIWREPLQQLGLGDFDAGSSRREWATLLRRGLSLAAWPATQPERRAFSLVTARALVLHGQQLTFASHPEPLLAASSVLAALTLRTLNRSELGMALAAAAYRMSLVGRMRVSRLLDRAARRRRPEAIGDARLRLHALECLAVRAMADGRWHGLMQQIDAMTDEFMRLAIPRHEMECRSLGAKLAFYQGNLHDALHRFTRVTAVSQPLGAGIGRMWGPLGEVEAQLGIGTADLESLRRRLEEARRLMNELENYDAAYTLRWFGLRARVAWRQGDIGALREAVLTGVATCSRIPFAGFWAHEGFAGIGEGLIRLRRHERETGGAVPATAAAWAAFRKPLSRHCRRFTPARALWHYLMGLDAAEAGRVATAAASLRAAVRLAARQGMRLELARCCTLIGALEADPGWSERAARLWREMGAAVEEPALRSGELRPAPVG